MKILFFAPHSAIWVHAFPEALIAEALQQNGHEIVYVSCGGTLNRFCVPMSAHKLAPSTPHATRQKVCVQCNRSDRILRNEFRFRGPSLQELVGAEEEREAEAILAGMTRESVATLERDGVAIGRLALYQLMLRRKRMDLDLTDVEWQEYLVELRNTLYAWQAGRKILDAEHPERVIVYNGLYSVNRVVCKLAEQRGVPSYFMHAGGNLSNRLQTLLLGRGDTFSFMPHVVSQWPRFADIPCSGRLLSLVTDHYVELLRGKSVFVYSKARSSGRFDARVHFGVRNNQRLLVATMGSYDEEVAAEMVGARRHRSVPLFPTQVDWIKAVLAFVAARPNFFLVIRVHPREFPNRRDNALSQHARLLRQVLQDLPPNAAVNWPSDGISVYDLADSADVFLNSWSSVGKEMSLLGIPVLIYSKELVFYPPDLNYVGTTEREYFGKLEMALQDGWDAERIRKTYRWCVVEYKHSLLDISESFSRSENRSFFSKGINKLMRSIAPYREQEMDCRNRAKRLSASDKINRVLNNQLNSVLDIDEQDTSVSHSEETDSLKREVRRLVEELYGTNSSSQRDSLANKLRNFSDS